MTIQEEVNKIITQFGNSEMAHYKIQLLFDQQNKDLLKEVKELKEANKDIKILFNNCKTHVNKKREEITNLKKQLERLNKRDCNADVQLCYATKDNPFEREDLKIVDVGVSDNIYIVESEVLKGLQKQLKESKKENERLKEIPMYKLMEHYYDTSKATFNSKAIEVLKELC